MDYSGNYNIRSNSISLYKGSNLLMDSSSLDTVVIQPTFTPISSLSSPNVLNDLLAKNISLQSIDWSSSAYFIQIIASFEQPVKHIILDRIHVRHGSIHGVSQQDSLWLFYVCPYHQGLIQVWSDEGAFLDDSGHFSRASELLELNVEFEWNHCHFVSLSEVNDLFVIQVDILCERSFAISPSNLSITISTLLSTSYHIDSVNPPLSHPVLLLKPQLSEAMISVSFTPSFIRESQIKVTALTISYSAVAPIITAEDIAPNARMIHVFNVSCNMECTHWESLTAVLVSSGDVLAVYPYDGSWKKKAVSMRVVVDVKESQEGSIYFMGVQNERGVKGVWKGENLPINGSKGRQRK